MQERAEAKENRIQELTDEEARMLFDRSALHYLGITADEFLRRWDAGEYGDPDDRTENLSEVMEVASLLPLVRAR